MGPKKYLAAAAIAVAATLTLAACGSGNDTDGMGDMPGMNHMSDTTSPTTSGQVGDFNDADVTFATDMISHHRQAVDMAKLAETRAKNNEVKALAMKIMNAQQPEIDTMSGWLASWGKPVPEEMGGMDMSGSMPGMMSEHDMHMLSTATGPEFDRQFLQMMIAHHQGAIEMAKTEQAQGTSPDAKALAAKITADQTAEIATMRQLLK